MLSLYNSILIRNPLVREMINKMVLFINLFRVLFRGTPRLIGERRLAGELRYLLKKYKRTLLIKEDKIWLEGKALRSVNSAIAGFIPLEGFRVNPGDEVKLRDIFLEKLYNNNPEVSRLYYKGFFLYWITFSLALFSNAMIISIFVRRLPFLNEGGITVSVFWIISNFFFLSQMLIFHKTRLRSIAMENNFVEASDEEEEAMLVDPDKPEALILVPAYKEEAELLRRSMFCHLLQKYTKKKIVLLWGNEFFTRDHGIHENTKELEDIVEGLNREFAFRYTEVNKVLSRVPRGKEKDTLSNLYREISLWIEAEGLEIRNSSTKYPTDKYVVENCFFHLRDFYRNRSMAVMDYDEKQIEKEIIFCSEIFQGRIEIFMRTKYGNVEQEKTKAGNLTAYLPLINRYWEEEFSPLDKRYKVSLKEEHNKYKYVSIFDCDTIARPEYLLRKIVYLEKEDREDIGLVQSPYIVPDPEPTITGSASGVHSFWFLPISLGLTSYGSSFWLGFNSCWRYDVIKKIPDFLAETIIEDVEVSLKIKKAGYRIVTSPEQQCVTYSPKDLRGVQVQRTRWASGGFRIVKIFLRDLKEKKYSIRGIREFFLRLNYIVNLNLLPLFLTMLFILPSPLHYPSLPYVSLQFGLYLWIYFVICSRKTRYSAKNLLDGLAISFFMNFYYLRGVKQSVKILFKREKEQFFESTPRSADLINTPDKKEKKQATSIKKSFLVDTFEIAGILTLLFIFGRAFLYNISIGYFYDFFPLYQLFCIFYGVKRFVGVKAFFQAAYHKLLYVPFRRGMVVQRIPH